MKKIKPTVGSLAGIVALLASVIGAVGIVSHRRKAEK